VKLAEPSGINKRLGEVGGGKRPLEKMEPSLELLFFLLCLYFFHVFVIHTWQFILTQVTKKIEKKRFHSIE
jgi:hypothetical protein